MLCGPRTRTAEGRGGERNDRFSVCRPSSSVPQNREPPMLRKGEIAAVSLLLAMGGTAMAGSLGGPLELADEGSFFVNGVTATSSHPGASVLGPSPPGTITVNQMYVQFRIPKTV